MSCRELSELLTVIIPTLDEAEGIGLVIEEVLSLGISRDNVLVVDGGSKDGSVDIARSKGVRVIEQEGRGKAAAIATALKHINTSYVAVLDGDYTYPANYIPQLLNEALKGYDLVIGVRRGKLTQPIKYRVGNYLLTKFFNLLFNTKLRDVLSGMYVVKTSRLRELNFEMEGFSIEAELVAHTASTAGKISEVPIDYRRRLGKKKLGVLHGFKIATDMIRLTWRYNPVFLIFIIGSLLLIPGLIIGAWVAYHYIFTGAKHYVRGLAAIMLTLTGLQSLAAAIITLYVKRIELRILRKLDELNKHH
ncbi:MAG: glycosyltransferase family 2 protein [Sulfolobales archaeon]|nr:glycosyltransferase family 2 protein [Sulfolobales archaeon]